MAKIDACKEKISLYRLYLTLCSIGFFVYVFFYFSIEAPSVGQKIFFFAFFVSDFMVLCIFYQKLLKEIKKIEKL